MSDEMSDAELMFATFSNFPECSIIQELHFSERCSFSLADEDCIERAYIFNYIQFLYCSLRPYNNFTLFLGVLVLLCITLIMFLILGITADKVFCPALQVLSVEFGMNENLAGVTVLAFGNGSPDLFTSLAAIDEPAKMMFSDLFGGAIYVHGVIGALICILSPFHLSAGNVMRDYGFLMLSVLHIDYCMSDGGVSVWEAIIILMVYVVYLAIVIGDQLLLKQYVKYMENKLANTTVLRAKQYDQMKELRNQATIEVLSRNQMTRAPKAAPQKPQNTPETRKRSTVNIEETRLSSYNGLGEANDDLWPQMWETLNPIDAVEWNASGRWAKVYICLRAPIDLAINLVIPIVDYELDRHGWSKLLNCVQIVGMPIFIIVAAQLEPESTTIICCVVVTVFTVPLAIFTYRISRTDHPPRFHCLLAVYSSIGAMFFIYVAASETVNILVVLGLITGSSNPFLGVTLLAWGNGIGDLVANMSLAASGYQTMAYAACLGGPFFNAVLSMGITFLIQAWNSEDSQIKVTRGPLGENCMVFMLLLLGANLFACLSTDFFTRRSIGYFSLTVYGIFLLYALFGELAWINTYEGDASEDEETSQLSI